MNNQQPPLLNVIIRTSNRPAQYGNCIRSIFDAAFNCSLRIRIITGYDTQASRAYAQGETIVDLTDMREQYGSVPFFYNLYLNKLLTYVHEGFAIFVDDDDLVLNGSLEPVCKHLSGKMSIIVPFMRGDFQKPTSMMMGLHKITAGYIGLPCLIVNVNDIEHLYFIADEYADYKAIKKLADKVPLRWINSPVVYSKRRNRGTGEVLY